MKTLRRTLLFTLLTVLFLTILPSSSANASGGTVDDFVTRLYTLCLNREPDARGLAEWSNWLADGTFTGTEVAHGFVFSNEFVTAGHSNEEYVKLLYRIFLGREYDQNGLEIWVDLMRNEGYGREAIFNGFSQSIEFGSICAEYGITQGGAVGKVADDISSFVIRFYQIFLGRGADPDGLAIWKEKLTTKELSAAEVARGFVFSEEFLSQNLDDATFIEYMYKAFLDRSADEAGLTAWIKGLQEDGWTREYVFRGFVGSNEFSAICETYGIERGSMEPPGDTPDDSMPEAITIFPEGTQNILLANGTTATLTFDETGTLVKQTYFDAENDSEITCLYQTSNAGGLTSITLYTDIYELIVQECFYSNGMPYSREFNGTLGILGYIDILSENADGTITVCYVPLAEDTLINESYYENGVLQNVSTDVHDKNGNSLRLESFSYNESGIIQSYFLAEYGNAVKNAFYYEDGTIASWSFCEYDENHILQKEYHYTGEGTERPTGIYEYDATGARIRSEEWHRDYMGNAYFYELAEYGKKIKRIDYNTDGSVESWNAYEYYNNGVLKKDTQYHRESTTLPESICEYDETGTEIRYEYWRWVDEAVIWYEIHENGKKTKHITYDDEGNIGTWYTYEYYSNGNTKKVIGYAGEGTDTLYQVNDYYESGKQKSYTYYVNGVVAGIIEYEESGITSATLEYNEKGLVVSWTSYEYYDNGQIKTAVRYYGRGTSTPLHINQYAEDGTPLQTTGQHVCSIDAEQIYAIRTGDTSTLTERELAAHNKLLAINAELGLDDMKDPMLLARAVHDYLIANVTYDQEHFANEIQGLPNPDEEPHYIESTLLDGMAVCSGYASSFRAFMELHGIHTEYVYNLDHGWNIVEIDGKWYHVDVTWDDTDVDDWYSDQYLMVDESVVAMAGGHNKWVCECGAHSCTKTKYEQEGIDFCFSAEEIKTSVQEQLEKDTITVIWYLDFSDDGIYTNDVCSLVYDILGEHFYYTTKILDTFWFSMTVTKEPTDITPEWSIYPEE